MKSGFIASGLVVALAFTTPTLAMSKKEAYKLGVSSGETDACQGNISARYGKLIAQARKVHPQSFDAGYRSVKSCDGVPVEQDSVVDIPGDIEPMVERAAEVWKFERLCLKYKDMPWVMNKTGRELLAKVSKKAQFKALKNYIALANLNYSKAECVQWFISSPAGGSGNIEGFDWNGHDAPEDFLGN